MIQRWTQEDVDKVNARRGEKLPAHLPPSKPKRQKHGNIKTEFEGRMFDSKAEARRAAHLRMFERAGQIDSLEYQPQLEIFVVNVAGERTHIGWFTPDFRYWEKGVLMIEDVKSPSSKTEAYELRKKLVEAIYGVIITEVL